MMVKYVPFNLAQIAHQEFHFVLEDLIQTLNVPLILTALLLRLKTMGIHVPWYFALHLAHQVFQVAQDQGIPWMVARYHQILVLQVGSSIIDLCNTLFFPNLGYFYAQ